MFGHWQAGWRVCTALGALLLAGLLTVSGCAHTVSQDKATGADGRSKGAKPIRLENGEGQAVGIITYPGGDRVDWKSVTLADEQTGSLEFTLKWQPPRRGLQLSFDVFDAWFHPVAKAKRLGSSVSKTLTLNGAKGKYFIRIFAPNRGDAGKYKLTLAFHEGSSVDASAMQIPEPPRLPALPAAVEPCDDASFDVKKPGCRNVCPSFGAPPGWPACAGKCPSPPDINIPSCLATMPCPSPPDRRVKACGKSAFPKCNPDNIDPGNPNCDNFHPDPIAGVIIRSAVTSDGMIITMNPGAERGVAKGWKGYIVQGDGDTPLPNGQFVVRTVTKRECTATVKLTQDLVTANQRVRLLPP